MYKISFIVPIYGVEKYLPKCLNSIYSQINDQCQVILVDDESPDNCPQICDEYKAKHPDITTVIHQKNLGLGGARNTGMKHAEGEYLFFIDSDDYLVDGAVPYLLSAIERFRADVFVFPFCLVDESDNNLGSFSDGFEMMQITNAKKDKKILTGIPSAWNKVCRAELYKSLGITFPSKVWYEDIRTTPKILSKAESVVYLDREMYNYLQREGSIMSSSKVERNVEIIEALDDLISWFKNDGSYDEFKEEIDYLVIDHVLVSASVRVIRSAGTKHPLLKRLRKYTEENCTSFKKGNNSYVKSSMPKTRKLIYSLLRKKLNFAVSLVYKVKK